VKLGACITCIPEQFKDSTRGAVGNGCLALENIRAGRVASRNAILGVHDAQVAPTDYVVNDFRLPFADLGTSFESGHFYAEEQTAGSAAVNAPLPATCVCRTQRNRRLFHST